MGFFSGLSFDGVIDGITQLGNTYSQVTGNTNTTTGSVADTTAGTVADTTTGGVVQTTPTTTGGVVSQSTFMQKLKANWYYVVGGIVFLIGLIWYFKPSKKRR